MRWSAILALVAAHKHEARAVAPAVEGTTYRSKTRRRGGVTMVGIPNKIRKRLGR
ncbi:MAG TPA: hypothetical protein VMW24_23250 [Sedimentisphaerales bacterium]|nr:hypothetical protein [Sedimentisphaerales bacterium]